jgi:putative ABC transport system permease protein
MIPRRDRFRTAPPGFWARLLGRILPYEERAETIGDFEERFRVEIRMVGATAARSWYAVQVLRLIPYLIKDRLYWSSLMLKNYLLIAWRNMKKFKAYSALNIFGLAVGLAVFILIMLFVRTELSYDRYHAQAANIYQINNESPGGDYLGSNIFVPSPGPMAAALVRDFPEVRAAARIVSNGNVLIKIGNESFLEKSFFWADSQIFDIFSFPLVRGDQASVLKDPFSILLSERESRRLFGGEDPIGRSILYQASGKPYEFRVAGVFRDIPANSHFVMDVVAPFETMSRVLDWDITEWGSNSFYTYVLLRPGTSAEALEAKLPAFIDKNGGDKVWSVQGKKMRFFLLPLTRIHLHSRGHFPIAPTADARFVFLFATIAVLVLIIACVNYMNLATARSLKRAKEIGLRKVVGAAKGQIRRQFLGDSTLTAFLSLLVAIGLVQAALPAFRSFVQREIAFNPFREAALMPGLILLALLVGAAAGIYPALVVSSFRPVATLKGTGALRFKGRILRDVLIVFQFAASITLIICTIGVRGQLRFIRNTDMGYAREQILVLRPKGGVSQNIEVFKAELRRNPSVLGIAGSASLPNSISSSTQAKWPGRPEAVQIPIYVQEADYDFVDLYGLEIVQGRSFSRSFPSDANGAFLINEAAQKALGWDDPIGREFNHWGRDKPAGRIVGMVKDFHMHSLHLPIMPLYVFLDPQAGRVLSIKIQGRNIPETIAAIKRIWDRFADGYPFEYSFFDEIFDQAYRTEQRLGTMYGVFAGLAVLIACLGLVGLAAFAAEQKTKEIGIRKVLGASSPGIIVLISREFMKWVVLANVVAWPVGYLAMKSWLQGFAYRAALSPVAFLSAGLAAFAIAAAVIALQTHRAASANPADSMRCE